MNNSLMGRLDRARDHEGDYDEASYALAGVVAEWIAERLSDPAVQSAFAEGTVRGYTQKDGAVEIVEYPPGWDAVGAQVFSP